MNLLPVKVNMMMALFFLTMMLCAPMVAMFATGKRQRKLVWVIAVILSAPFVLTIIWMLVALVVETGGGNGLITAAER